MGFKKRNKISRGRKSKKTTQTKVVPAQQNRLEDMQNIYQTDCPQTSVSHEVPMLDHQDSNTAENSTSLQKDTILPESLRMTEINTNEHTPCPKDLEVKTTERFCLDSSAPNTSCSFGQNNSTQESIPAIDHPLTPDIPIPPEDVFSPNTVNEIRHTIRALFPNGPPKPPPVIPVKRHKKGDTPYIVGCTERKRVPESKSLNFFKGDDYGITDKTNAFDDEDASLHSPAKRRRITYNGKMSKSRFNPQSEEIAARLKINDKVDELLRKSHVNDTNSFMSKPYFSRPPAFSPIPSTSKDNETILKNEKHFNESLNFKNDNFAISDDEELPVVMLTSKGKQKKKKNVSLLQNENLNTIKIPSSKAINDIVSQINSDTYLKEIDFNAIFSSKKSPKTENFTETKRSISPIVIDDRNDDENVVEDKLKVNKSPIPIDTIEIGDEYSSITYEDKYGMPKAEYVGDVDDVLAEYEAYKKKRASKSTSIVTIVDPVSLQASHSEIKTKVARRVPSTTTTNNNTIDLLGPHAASNEAKLDEVCKEVPSISTTNNNTVDLVTPQAPNKAKSDEVCKGVPSTSTATNNTGLVTPHTVLHETKRDEFCKEVPSISPTVIEIPDVIECAMNVSDGKNKLTPSFSWKDDVEIISETLPDRNFNTSSNNDVEIVEGDFSSSTISNTRNRRNEGVLSDLSMFFSMIDHTLNSNWMTLNGRRKRTTKKPKKTTQKSIATVGTTCENEAPSINGIPPTTSQPPANGERNLGDCPICLENLSRNSVASTTCGHVFCLDCLKQSLKSSGKRCPTCRKVLKGTGYHQIFL